MRSWTTRSPGSGSGAGRRSRRSAAGTRRAVIDHVALRLRDDAVTETDEREANQKSAPAVDAGLFLVPRVIE